MKPKLISYFAPKACCLIFDLRDQMPSAKHKQKPFAPLARPNANCKPQAKKMIYFAQLKKSSDFY